MITSVELSNFLSHKKNIIEFDSGLTVLIGSNGAGKSSIMDAIIFSLFGVNRRGSLIETLQKEGENQTYTKTSFQINGNKFHALKKIEKGASKGHELSDGSGTLIAKSARETIAKIQEIIGLDYNALKIASIVPADELTKIVTDGSELRSLVDKVIGAEKYSKLEQILKNGIKEFKEDLTEKYGYTYENVGILENLIKDSKKEIFDSTPKKVELENAKEETTKIKVELEKQIENDVQKETQLKQVESKKDEFITHVKKEIEEAQKKTREEKKIHDACEGRFPIAAQSSTLEHEVENYKSELDAIEIKLQKLRNDKSSFGEKEKLADKLKLTDDGRCPVCNTEVDQLNPLFQKDHLKTEIKSIEEKIVQLQKEKSRLEESNKNAASKLEKAREAITTLEAHGISDELQLRNMAKSVKAGIEKIRKYEIAINSGQLLEVSSIDETAEKIYQNILQIEKDSEGFNQEEFGMKRKNLGKIQAQLHDIVQRYGEVSNNITSAQKSIDDLSPILEEMKLAKQYVSEIVEINSNVFSIQSKTFTGLRHFALSKISEKTSYYLGILKIGVKYIKLRQDKASIKIECETISGQRPVENLSSGEQTCVALAVRLAMAELMTKSPLKVMMLDEPTAHLDNEHLPLFLEALQQLTSRLNQNQNFQFIISTHQEELWANAKVGAIYKLENPTEHNTVIERS